MLLRKARIRGIYAAAGGVRGLEPRPFPSSDHLRPWRTLHKTFHLNPWFSYVTLPSSPEGKWHMATKPLQDDPSGPDTEYSKSENIQDLEPVLLLRTAKSLILPLRIPDRWEEQRLPASPTTRSIGDSPVLAFKATTHVLDPGTRRPHIIT